GIYHSGVEIHGHEYCFGGHEYEGITGVFVVEAKIGPPGVLFKQSIHMGCTELSDEAIGQVLKDLSKEFIGTSYNLLTRNCNHFTETLVQRLVKKPAPKWINRAAKLGTMFPCIIPTEWVEPPDLEAGRNSVNLPSETNQPTTAINSPGSGSQSPSTTLSCSSKTPLKPRDPSPEAYPRHPRPQASQSLVPDTHPSHRQTHTSATTTQKPRRSSFPNSRRPSTLEDNESIVLPRPSPLIEDELNMDNPVKEPDTCRPDVIRSATRLSMSASLQEMELL
ncbi:PPPDE putative peptidase domain-containing protein, partial [Phycomyces blakesleeanus]